MGRGSLLLVLLVVPLCSGCLGATAPRAEGAHAVSLAIVPGEQGIGVGDRLRLMLVARHEDGTTEDTTARARWRVSKPGILRLARGGVVTAVSRGTATVTAVLGGRRATTTVEVGTRYLGPLRTSKENPRYFVDRRGRVVYLAGAHTWDNLVDQGIGRPQPFDYGEFLHVLQLNDLRVFRMWAWEGAEMLLNGKRYVFSPSPYRRTGPGRALDGGLRFDLTQFNPQYFSRLRKRVIAARERGIYVIVMLFNGWSLSGKDLSAGIWEPWRGHPFNRLTNVNGVNGDPLGRDVGELIHTLADPRVTRLQESYVARVMRAVDDQPNVLYEISNESSAASLPWQNHLVRFVRANEPTGRRHPIGITVPYPGGNNAALLASTADWISPNGDVTNPAPASGQKVVLVDTDHLCGVCGDRSYPWKAFARGLNPMLMDPWDGRFVRAEGNPWSVGADDPRWPVIRRRLGVTEALSERLDLAHMTPAPQLASSGYCLSDVRRGTYLVYLPDGGSVHVDVSASRMSLRVEWIDPDTGVQAAGGTVAGGAVRTLQAPGRDDAVLLLAANPARRPARHLDVRPTS
jgi:hypothetical protein